MGQDFTCCILGLKLGQRKELSVVKVNPKEREPNGAGGGGMSRVLEDF